MVAAITGWAEPNADYLWSLFSELDVPEGIRVELIEGEIVVSPPPFGDHEHDVGDVLEQIVRSAARDFSVSGTKGVQTPRGLYIPDVTVVDRGGFRGQESWMPAEQTIMVVEATSGRPDTDREVKRLGYAAAGVPLYLLIDRSRKEVVLFSEPRDGDYLAHVQVPFGSPLELPAPLSFPLDTTEFV